MTLVGAPGVKIIEGQSGSMPIQGVGTSVGAFIGFTQTYDPAEGDPTDPEGVKPQLVTSWPQYKRVYGEYRNNVMLPHAVHGFFYNGGSACYIVRIRDGSETSAPSVTLSAVDRPDLASAEIKALDPARRIEVEVVAPPPPAEDSDATTDYLLRVYVDDELREEITGLQFGRNARALERAVKEQSEVISLSVPDVKGASMAERLPAGGRFALESPAPAIVQVTPADLKGSEADRTGYSGLAIADDVTIVAIPDLVTIATRADGTLDEQTYLSVAAQLIDFCEAGKMMAIVEVPPGYNATSALDFRSKLGRDTAFGTLYYPSLVVDNPLYKPSDPDSEPYVTVPCAGHVAGVWARTDTERGVWKAPANENLRDFVRLERSITEGEQDLLNPVGVNCIRAFGTFGTRIWGARTLAMTDPSWRYIPVRRLFNFVEESIRRGTRWAVFEPNDQDLRERVKRNTTSFLRGLHRQGALVGPVAEQAFFVLCDATNNPPSSVDEGKLFVEVGICPVKPAEFVIFRISQWQGGSETTE